jgi:hypothetical protein
MSLFKDEGQHIVIDPEIKLIGAFNELIKRDKGSKNDAQGRKKLQATRELAYVYHNNDYRSPYQRYSDKERFTMLVQDLNLGEDWKPDQKIIDAENKYQELNETSAIQSLKEARQTLNTSAQVNKKMREQIIELANSDDPETLSSANDLLTKTLQNNEKIPKVLKQIETTEEKVRKQEQESGTIQGSEEKGYFEDPDN